MKTTLAALLAMLLGGLIGCADWGHDDDRDRDRAQGMYADDDTSMSRGGPHDDWTRLQDDPVCGRTVNPKTAVTEVYDDQTYYFHDEECAKKFKENPQAFISGVEAKDPVCGMDVDPKTAMWTEEYDHRKYYFDTKECAQRFKDNPHAYMPGGDDRPGMMAATKDPVCGRDVDPKTAKWTEEYDHKKYYFDSKDCATKFKHNPHAYMPGGDDRPGVKEVR
jgi:YHS domain-containing protein